MATNNAADRSAPAVVARTTPIANAMNTIVFGSHSRMRSADARARLASKLPATKRSASLSLPASSAALRISVSSRVARPVALSAVARERPLLRSVSKAANDRCSSVRSPRSRSAASRGAVPASRSCARSRRMGCRARDCTGNSRRAEPLMLEKIADRLASSQPLHFLEHG